MRVYCFDPATGVYTGESEADPSPLEPGCFLLPAFATFDPPPPAEEGMRAVMVEGAWALEAIPAPPALETPGAPGEPAEPELPRPPSEPPTFAERADMLRALVQEYMDAMARSYNYDDISTAVTYAEEPAVPKFQNEGRAMRAWRSLVWEACYDLLARVQAGEAEEPSVEQLHELLPRLFVPPLEPVDPAEEPSESEEVPVA
ncbi:hypothetical protein QTH87_06005 [Variovorax sp. J22P168]|uniref:hypothetical protein n=1 Tax=Variovorax jilinensis TaxID=3053513 RepID=UPI002574FA58|nr:hypothetical protein [Variovorax sp. J22P168]MDM0011992.1 hypothetical protein [Variovorax sp. J22P168]